MKFNMCICYDPTIPILNYALEKDLDVYTRQWTTPRVFRGAVFERKK